MKKKNDNEITLTRFDDKENFYQKVSFLLTLVNRGGEQTINLMNTNDLEQTRLIDNKAYDGGSSFSP